MSVVFAVKLEIDTTADERNQTNSNSLDMRPKGGARNADGTDHMRVDTEEIREELKYTLLETNAGHTLAPHTVAAVAVLLLVAITRDAMMDVWTTSALPHSRLTTNRSNLINFSILFFVIYIILLYFIHNYYYY